MKVLRHNNRIVNSGQGSPILTYTKPVEIEAFTTVWDTRNLNGTGESPTNTVLDLSLSDDFASYGGHRYNFTVYWGDGTSSTVTSGDDPNRIHTYSEPGVKEIKITGKFGGFNFYDYPHTGPMLLEIKKWNSVELDAMGYMFQGCINLEITATDAPIFENWVGWHGSNAYRMFYGCENIINSNFIGWDIEPITSDQWSLRMFDQPLESPNFSNWNINGNYNNVQSNSDGFNLLFSEMGSNFNPIGLDTWIIPPDASNTIAFERFFGNIWSNIQIPSSTYDDILNAWAQNAINNDGPYNITVGFGASQYTSASSTAIDTLTNTYNWTINDGGQQI